MIRDLGVDLFMCAKSFHWCPTPCDPMDYSPPSSTVHGILQARILECAAISFSRGSSQPRDWTPFSYVSCIDRHVLYYQHHLQSPWFIHAMHVLSHSVMSSYLWPHGLQPTRLLCPWGFSRQEYWSGLPFLSLGSLPNPGIKPRSPTLQADSLLFETPGKPLYL